MVLCHPKTQPKAQAFSFTQTVPSWRFHDLLQDVPKEATKCRNRQAFGLFDHWGILLKPRAVGRRGEQNHQNHLFPTAKLAVGSLAQIGSGAIRRSFNTRFQARFRRAQKVPVQIPRLGSGRFWCRY